MTSRVQAKPKAGGMRRGSGAPSGCATTYHKHLSKFQIEKFTYLFNHLFDIERQNNLLEQNDILALVEKMRVYAGWKEEDEKFKNIQDVHRVFYECLRDQVTAERMANAEDEIISDWQDAMKPDNVDTTSITLTQWLNMWGRLCYGSSGLNDFPIWVQLLPNIFFDVIDTEKDNILSIEEYNRFYKDFVGVKENELQKVTDEGYRVMTAGGDYTFNRDHFAFCFANFLLGRSLSGPGKYIFGVFDNTDLNKPFKIIYNVEEDEDEE